MLVVSNACSRTLKDALLTLTDSGIRMGIKHTDAATQMLNEIIKPLEAFIKQSEGEKKRVKFWVFQLIDCLSWKVMVKRRLRFTLMA